MARGLLYLLLAFPLLMPTGFCPCHLLEAAEDCAVDDDSTPGDDHHDDPNCPCKNVDAGVRGFRSHQMVEVVRPVAATTIDCDSPTPIAAVQQSERDDVPISCSSPRYLMFLTLLV